MTITYLVGRTVRFCSVVIGFLVTQVMEGANHTNLEAQGIDFFLCSLFLSQARGNEEKEVLL